MLKRLTRKLLTLSVLCAALAAVASSPAKSPGRYCLPGEITNECTSGLWCCDRNGCTCGYP